MKLTLFCRCAADATARRRRGVGLILVGVRVRCREGHSHGGIECERTSRCRTKEDETRMRLWGSGSPRGSIRGPGEPGSLVRRDLGCRTPGHRKQTNVRTGKVGKTRFPQQGDCRVRASAFTSLSMPWRSQHSIPSLRCCGNCISCSDTYSFSLTAISQVSGRQSKLAHLRRAHDR